MRWDVAELAAFGGVAQVSYRVAASSTITNSNYAVSATGGFSASGSDPVVTRVVDAQSSADAVTPSSLQQASLAVEIPADAADQASDNTTVTVRSHFDSSAQGQTTLTTTARRLPVEVEERLLLPMIRHGAGAGLSASITGISVAGDRYAVSYVTQGFTPQLPGQHVHFFFNTVPPSQAGMPGSGP